MKRIAVWVLALAVVASAAWARPVAKDAADMVKQTTEEMLAALKTQQETIRDHPEKVYDLVSEIVLPHFDFEYMAQSVLGKYWNRASEQQQNRFTEEFRNLLVRTYASSLAEYSGQTVNFLPLRPSGRDDEITVRTEIEQRAGFPVPVDYELKYQDDAKEWKVVGVTIDGLNLVLNYRTSFGNEIRQQGLDATIDNLAARNREGT